MKRAKAISIFAAAMITVICATALTAYAFTEGGAEIGESVMLEKKEQKMKGFSESITSKLDGLVTDGTITRDQENAIKRAIESARPRNHDESSGEQKGEKKGPLSSLVAAGTITQDQANAVREAIMQGRKDSKGNFNVSAVLDSLVSAGTITQEQENAIRSEFESAKARMQENHIRARNSIKNALDGLVTAGTINQEQENAVLNALMNDKR